MAATQIRKEARRDDGLWLCRFALGNVFLELSSIFHHSIFNRSFQTRTISHHTLSSQSYVLQSLTFYIWLSNIWHSIFDFQIFDFHGSFFLGAAVLRYLTFKGLTVRFNGNQRDVTLAWKSGTNNKPNFESDFPSVIWVGEAGNRVS